MKTKTFEQIAERLTAALRARKAELVSDDEIDTALCNCHLLNTAISAADMRRALEGFVRGRLAVPAEPLCRNCLGSGIEHGVYESRPCEFCKKSVAAPASAPAVMDADIAAIRHTLMTGLAHNPAIHAVDRIAAERAVALPAEQPALSMSKFASKADYDAAQAKRSDAMVTPYISQEHFDRAFPEPTEQAERPEPALPAMESVAVLGEKLFSFQTHADWVNKASRQWMAHGLRASQTVCIDQKSRICAWGEHFRKAEEDDSFPIDVYRMRADMSEVAA